LKGNELSKTYPETKKKHKNVPYLTLTANLKPQLSLGLVAFCDNTQEMEWFYSGTHTHLLAYLLAPDPHGAVLLLISVHR